MMTRHAPSSRIHEVVGELASNYRGDAGTANEPQNRFRLMLVHSGYENLGPLIEDLKSCDYPSDTEVLLLSAAELFRAPLHLIAGNCATDPEALAWNPECSTYRKTYERWERLSPAARDARAKIQAAFPRWKITFDRPLGWQANLIVIGIKHNSSADHCGLAEMIRKITSESKIPFRVAGTRSEDDLLVSQARRFMEVSCAASQTPAEELRPQTIGAWMNHQAPERQLRSN